MQTLSNEFIRRYRVNVVVVGCGGTGAFVVEGLCRLLPAAIPLVLVDPDRVEERNLKRQNFFREELGQLKSEALAVRLSRKFERPVAYSTMPVSFASVPQGSLLIGCVDTGPARKDIAKKFSSNPASSPAWWIDSGNGENFGQILVGNTGDVIIDRYGKDYDVFAHWPLPTIQLPEILLQQPVQRNCADISDQGPTINQSMASLVIETARRLLIGTCPWVQLYLDMEMGTLRPVYPSRELLKEILNKKNNKGG